MAQAKAVEKEEPKQDVAVRMTGSDVAVIDIGDDAGVGMENVDRDERRIPFVKYLDAKAPQCAPDTGVPGAQPGFLMNMSTNQVFDGKKGFIFIPCHRSGHYVEWIPRNPTDGSGGGFVGVVDLKDDRALRLRAEQGRFGKLKTNSNGVDTELAETYYLTGLFLPDDDMPFAGVIAFSSTQIKKYQAFIDRYLQLKYKDKNGTMVTPPLWAHKWRLTSVFERNKRNQTYYGWNLSLAAKKPDGTEDVPFKSFIPRTDSLYAEGRKLYDAMTGGTAKVDISKSEPEREPGDDSDAEDKKIPM